MADQLRRGGGDWRGFAMRPSRVGQAGYYSSGFGFGNYTKMADGEGLATYLQRHYVQGFTTGGLRG
jgi:hypothetical protein